MTHAGEGPAIATSRFVVQIEGRSESNGVLVDDECNAASQEDGEDEEEEVNGSSQQSSALLPSNGRSDKLQSMVSYGAFYFIDFFYYFNALGWVNKLPWLPNRYARSVVSFNVPEVWSDLVMCQKCGQI